MDWGVAMSMVSSALYRRTATRTWGAIGRKETEGASGTDRTHQGPAPGGIVGAVCGAGVEVSVRGVGLAGESARWMKPMWGENWSI